MSALTPEQMRELADLGPLIHIESWDTVCAALHAAALHAAADQLEAVERFASVRATAAHALGREVERDWLDLLAILTTPQEKP